MAEPNTVNVGDWAPDFTLPCATGEMVRPADFRERAAVVLFFYPRDDSPGCTAEACSFRDASEQFRRAGAEVIGISSDPPGSHRRFADRFRLPFRLLSDADGRVRASYGIARTLGLIPGRVTFVIDRDGIIRHAFSSQFRPARHVSEALGVLKSLRGDPEGQAG